jgi:hypothetical protein
MKVKQLIGLMDFMTNVKEDIQFHYGKNLVDVLIICQ